MDLVVLDQGSTRPRPPGGCCSTSWPRSGSPRPADAWPRQAPRGVDPHKLPWDREARRCCGLDQWAVAKRHEAIWSLLLSPTRPSDLGRIAPETPEGPTRRAQQRSVRPEVVQLAQPGFIRDGTWGVSVRRIESEEPSTRRKSGHEPAPFGTTRHYVAQDRPLHVVVGGCALSSEGVCILGFRPDLHRVQGAVAAWVKTGENPAAARRAGGKRGGMQGPCGCALGTPF